MSNGADHINLAAECNNTNRMDSCDNNLMDRKTNRMAGRTATIDNNSNDGKAIVTCDSSSLAGAYNNSPLSIMHSSNYKVTAACGSDEASKTCNNNPTNIIHGSSRSYISHIRDG